MEANVCDVNRLDSDVLLPPRKRLLACLKKQNSDINQNPNPNSNPNPNPNPPSTCTPINKLDTRISYLLRAHLTNDNPSQEEIVIASRSAAEVAVKVAMAARALAEEKAVIASKAMAAAKKALELVAIVDNDEDISSCPEEHSKKNKSKKEVQVQMLYNNKNDEEIARKLHQAINSSPRISKTGNPSDSKGHTHKHKKLKTSENGRSIVHEGISIFPFRNDKEVENTTNGERILLKVKSIDDDMNNFGRKRGRMKQKKLPLSICHDRDQANPKEDHASRSAVSVGLPAGSNVVERNLWKCQSFKATTCVTQNKVMQS